MIKTWFEKLKTLRIYAVMCSFINWKEDKYILIFLMLLTVIICLM
jgi:hypothetical protein